MCSASFYTLAELQKLKIRRTEEHILLDHGEVLTALVYVCEIYVFLKDLYNRAIHLLVGQKKNHQPVPK